MTETDRRDQQLAHYRFLEMFQESLTGARDLTGLYGAVVHRIASGFSAQAVCLNVYDEVSGSLTMSHQAGARVAWDQGALLQAVKTGRMVVRDTTAAVPIISPLADSQTHCWGVIAIARERRAGVLFNPTERQTLRGAADRVGAELQHRQAFMLDDVLDGLLRKTKPIDIYMHALREIRRFVRYDHSASVMTIQRGMAQITVRTEKVVMARGRRESLADSSRRGKALRLTQAQTRFLSRLDRPIELRREDDRYHLVGEQDPEAAGLWRVLCLNGRDEGSILCFPLVFGGQVLGVLRLAANRPMAFECADQRALERFARLLSVTLYRSELYHHSDRQLKAIKQIGRAITESLGVEEVCRQVLQLALRVLNVEVGAVGLVDESDQILLVAHQGSTLAEIPTLSPGEGIAGEVVRTGAARAVSDVTEHPGYVRFNGRVRSQLTAPIVYNREVIGFLDVESFEEGRFREEDEEAMSFLEAMANQAAIAIKTAQLHDAARERLGGAMSIDPTLSIAGLHDLLVEELQDKIEQLAGANDRLAAANQAKSEFLAHMSHDLRGPLNVIVGLSSLLVDPAVAPGLTGEKWNESLELIRSNGERLSSLIGNILDISALEAGRVELDVSDIDLGATFDYLAAMARALASESEKQLDISVRIDGERRTIRADEAKFTRIVQNLLVNAVKFTPSGGSISIIVRAANRDGLPGQSGGRDLHVTVADTGVGIALEDQERIFLPFQQVQHTGSRQYHGTGIGLTVVEQLVKLHGGRVWLESTPELGSSFHVVLPDAIQSTETAIQEAREPVVPRLMGEPQTILVVEDIPAHMSVMRLAVTSRGYRMQGVATAREALDWLEHNCPGLIVMDMQLPDTDGFALASEIRSRVETHDIPIVGVSADALSVNEERAKASGCNVFLTKPVDIAQLLLVIEAATA